MDTTEEDDQVVPLESLEDEHMSFDGASLMLSMDGRSSSEVLYGDLPSSSRSSLEHSHAEDGSGCSTDGSSPLGWPLQSNRADKCHSGGGGGARMAFAGVKSVFGSISTAWDVQRSTELSEVDVMREKFAKLLLGEDMSGGGKGVCSALAISNAITNLSASIFGELWRLEPLANERKKIWKREMDWLLSVADHIVELVPSVQTFPDGSHFEVMISRPRSDLHANLPALRKLDAMLLESLDNFNETEFWYVDQGISISDEDGQSTPCLQRQEEKWWLPKSKVPINGLSDDGKKRLQHQRECLNQILKAAMAINSQVLSEIEIPDVYWDALPKNGKASLGDTIYRCITSEYFSAEALLCSLDLSSEHKAVEVANRIEAAIHMWRRKGQPRSSPKSSKEFKHKNSWGILRDFVSDADRREFLAGRAESLLLCLKQKIPGLRQSLLDMTKIQHNKDVGQSILESYSRVLESLAFNIIARIDDVLYVDDMTRRAGPVNSSSC